jgi:hypothetical protein
MLDQGNLHAAALCEHDERVASAEETQEELYWLACAQSDRKSIEITRQFRTAGFD